MVDDGRSHYDVLGIEPSADKEQIRAAYQERLDQLRAEQTSQQEAKKPNESAIAASRDEEARLRSAWQVLSDPYQRGRYDATLPASPAHPQNLELLSDHYNLNGPVERLLGVLAG